MLARWPAEFIQAAMIFLRRGEVAGAPGEVLADAPAAAVREVAGGADALGGLRAVAAGVGEVGVLDHVVAVGERGALQAVVGAQRGEAAVGALAVEQAERRLGDGGEVGGRRAAARRWRRRRRRRHPRGGSGRGAGRRDRPRPPGESSRRPPSLVSVIASPRRASVTPRLSVPSEPVDADACRGGRGGRSARAAAGEPEARDGQQGGNQCACALKPYLSIAQNHPELEETRRTFTPRRCPARQARRGRRGR